MWQPFEVLLKTEFFKGALPEAAFWGRIALRVGVGGLAISVLLVLTHLRDQISLVRGQNSPDQYRPPKWGPLSQSLREFFADPLHNAPFSPDAAAEYVVGRLEATRDVTLSAIRYFSYAPLLFGLMGTIFALRALLVIQGNTLQQIEPHLAGVFAGTLAGIVGSLVASAGGLILDWAWLSTMNRAQDFIHRHILPTLPERRIAIRIEDAVLALIAEKAQAVAESFRNSMQPVAARMEQIAERCGKAAEGAARALSEAARAVREAGDLETASRDFKIGAEQLSDATKQTAEVILRVGEIRQSLAELLGRIRETAENLGGTSTRLSLELVSQIKDLTAQGERLQTNVAILHPAIEALSAELVRRAGVDSAHLEVIRGHIETTSRHFGGMTDLLRESSNELKAVPIKIETIAGTIAEGARQGVTTGLDHVTDQIAKKLDNAVQILERSAVALSKTYTAGLAGTDGGTSLDVGRSIRQASEKWRWCCNRCRRHAVRALPRRPMVSSAGFGRGNNGQAARSSTVPL